MIKNFLEYVNEKIDFRKFGKFGIVGLINTAVDWLSFAFLIEILNTEPRFAHVIAQSLAVINSYIMNKHWTFKDKSHYKKSIFKFLAVQGASLILGYLGMLLFHDTLGVNEYLSKLAVVGVTVILNYFGNKLFVFRG